MRFTTLIILFFFSIMLSAQTDLAIAINGSASISNSEFQLQKDAISNCVSNLPRNGSVGFALVQYAQNTTTIHVPYMLIDATTDIAAITTSINAINQISGQTNSGDGIIEAANEILNNGTMGSTKVVVLATDGQTNSGTNFSTAINAIQTAGIDEFGVIVIDVMSVLGFYSPFPYGGGTAEFADDFAEFSVVLEQYCQRVVGPMINNQIPTMGEWGLISLSFLLMIVGVVRVKESQLALS